MKFDYHTHHYRCGHADGDIREYIEAAIRNDLQIIGISDHSPYFGREEDQAYPKIAMAKSDFRNYVSEVLRLKEEYKDRIEVMLGIESDFFQNRLDSYKQAYEGVPFDYIIGSIHSLGGISIFNRNRWKKLDQAAQIREKESYLDAIQASARSGMFDILGHIDAMKGYYPAYSDINTPAVEETLRIIAECDVAIEINTSAKLKAAEGWYPSDDVLERALHYGVYVTFGSDAHTPTRVGDEFEQVRVRLKEIGFREWAYFRGRERFTTPL